MDKPVFSSNSTLDSSATTQLLVKPTGSVIQDTIPKEEQLFFHKANEASIIVNVKQRNITSQTGLYSLLGQSFESKNLDDFIDLIQSEDKNLIKHICRSYLDYCCESLLFPQNSSLNFTYRMKTQNNESIKLLTQIKVLEIHDFQVTKILIKFTNISFLCTDERVIWTLQADPEQRLNFRKFVAKKYEKLFTKRETEIIQQIQLGLSNIKIGEKLFISDHTVATHRKRILKKSKCHSANELVAFCKERGIL